MALLESYVAQPPPLYETEQGAVRVQGTRVSLDTVIACLNQGYTAEDIVRSFDTLRLRNVYAIIVYYLDNKETVDAYIRRREAEAAEFRARLAARRSAKASLAQI